MNTVDSKVASCSMGVIGHKSIRNKNKGMPTFKSDIRPSPADILVSIYFAKLFQSWLYRLYSLGTGCCSA